jgi:hypothetical protein
MNFRQAGDGELYAYLPPGHPNTDYTLLAVPPHSSQNRDYGFSIGRGAWRFQAGKWNTLTQCVKLNDVGYENGSIKVWFNGRLVIDVHNIDIRDYINAGFSGVHFQTFFGGEGSTSEKVYYTHMHDRLR